MVPVMVTERLRERWPSLTCAWALCEGVRVGDVAMRTEQERRSVMQVLNERAADIESRVGIYEQLFKANGFVCPLGAQLRRVRTSGFPKMSPVVMTLLIAELRTGVLMGIQDCAHITGGLQLDTADEDEAFVGMRDVIRCARDEPVIRDDSAIIASVFQGPDKRTAVNETTSAVIVVAFGYSGIGRETMMEGLEAAVRLLQPDERCPQGIADVASSM